MPVVAPVVVVALVVAQVDSARSLRKLWLLLLLLGLLLLLDKRLQQCCHLSNSAVYPITDSLWVDSLTRVVPDCRLVLIVPHVGLSIRS